MNPDLIYEVAPLFKQDLSSVVVDVGGTAVFTCRVCGRPRPTVIWHGPNKTELVGGPRVALSYSEDGEATLKVRKGWGSWFGARGRWGRPGCPAILVFLIFPSFLPSPSHFFNFLGFYAFTPLILPWISKRTNFATLVCANLKLLQSLKRH